VGGPIDQIVKAAGQSERLLGAGGIATFETALGCVEYGTDRVDLRVGCHLGGEPSGATRSAPSMMLSSYSRRSDGAATRSVLRPGVDQPLVFKSPERLPYGSGTDPESLGQEPFG